MAYSQVVIVCPNKFYEGERVDVEARVKNLGTSSINFTVSSVVDGEILYFGNWSKWIAPGDWESWDDHFIMPGKGVVIKVYSWYFGSDNSWHLDDESSKTIYLEQIGDAEFRNLDCSYAKR